MSTTKKHLALLLTLVMMISMFSACGDKQDNAGNSSSAGTETSTQTAEDPSDDRRDINGLKLPLSAEKEELTVWVVYSGTVMSDLNDIEGVKKIEEATNVHINWVPVNLQEVSEKLGICLASNDYPDIIYPGSNGYPGGYNAGIEDGVIYPDIDSLIRNCMPNYMAYLEGNEEARREATTDDGKLMLKNIVGKYGTAESEGNYVGLAYRADILEDLGLDVPTTIEEWHDALAAAKENGIPTPFMLDTNGGSPLALSWGVVTTSSNLMQLEGDKVVCGYAKDEFKGYLDTMRQWYSEGLISPNFTSFIFYPMTPGSVENNECLLYSTILSAFTGRNYYNNRMITNESVYLQPLVPPAPENGVPLQWSEKIIAKDLMYITTSCEKPELAAQWLDYLYTDEGARYLWYGIEGETYEFDENNEPQFTEMVIHPAEEGVSPQQILQKYCLSWGDCWIAKHDISASHKISTAAAGGVNQELEAVGVWSEPSINLALPNRSMTLTEDESYEITNIQTTLSTMIQEYTVNYIIGADVIPFEEFQQQLVEFGLEDVVATYQAAYDRYYAR